VRSVHDEVSDAFAAFLLEPSTADPFPLFRRLREIEPVHRTRLGTWAVVGYPEAEQVSRHRGLRREPAAAAQWRPLGREGDPPDVVDALDTWLSNFIFRDPPAHDRLRRLVARAFTARAVAIWRGHVERVVEELLVAMADAGRVDFMSAFAFPVPERVICAVLGVPYQDHALWSRWFRQTSEPGNLWTRRPGDDVGATGQVRLDAQRAFVNLCGYFRELVATRRGGSPGTDLVSLLLEEEASGDRLSQRELVATLVMLVGAGHTTTAHLLGNGVVAFLDHPDQLERLGTDPGAAGAAVDEVLRYRSPSRGQPYVAAEELLLGPQTVRPGDHVYPYYNAANRDPRRFPDPDRFDITRDDGAGLGFGGGTHYCVGAALARLEAEVAIAALAEKGQINLALPRDDIEWIYSSIHGPRSLPIEFSLR
jgi:cytochrome P450